MIKCFEHPKQITTVVCAIGNQDVLTIDCGYVHPLIITELSRIYCRDGAPARTPQHAMEISGAFIAGALLALVFRRLLR